MRAIILKSRTNGNSRGVRLSSLLLALSFFAFSMPFYLWKAQFLYYGLVVISAVVAFFDIKKFNSRKIFFAIILSAIIIYLSYSLGENTFGTIAHLLFVPLVLIEDDDLKDAFSLFYKIYVTFLVLSIINYFFYLIRFPLPHITVDSYNSLKWYTMEAYPFLVVPNKLSAAFRFHGLYEEPGNLGTTAIMILGLSGMNLRDKKTWVIIISGLLSLSLFFYVAFAILLFVKLIERNANWKQKMFFVIFFLIFIVLVFTDGTILNRAIGDRLVINWTTLTFSGDNRAHASLFKYYTEIRWKDPAFYIGGHLAGLDSVSIARIISGSAGYRNAILQYGLVGLVLYSSMFIFLALKNMTLKKDWIIFTIIFILILYQRAFLLDRLFLLLIYTWIISKKSSWFEEPDGSGNK